MENSTPIILVRQLHKAKRAGDHYDLRVVIGDKAYSWATKKEMPELGKPHIIFEQPIHDRKYALSKKVVIPPGQYGAGVTTLDFAQKGKASVTPDEYHLDLNNGERFFLKRLNEEKYGEKAWLFARKRTYREKEELALKKQNKYLEKAAAFGNHDLNRSVEDINEVYRRKGLPEVTAKELKDEFRELRPVSGRIAGGILGGVIPVAGNIAGYIVGKSLDNSKAGANLTNKYLLKAASRKNSATTDINIGIVSAGLGAIGGSAIQRGTTRALMNSRVERGLQRDALKFGPYMSKGYTDRLRLLTSTRDTFHKVGRGAGTALKMGGIGIGAGLVARGIAKSVTE